MEAGKISVICPGLYRKAHANGWPRSLGMSNTVSTLNDVIEILKDGQEGYRQSAGEATSPDLKELFSKYSLQRSKFAGELQQLSRELGEKEPATTGSTAGAIHRGWINLKAALVSKNDHAILEECERGEDSAVDTYEKALGVEDLDSNVASTLRSQFAEVKAAHDNVKALRDGLAAE